MYFHFGKIGNAIQFLTKLLLLQIPHHFTYDISKAFYMAYTVCKGNSDVSSYEFTRRISLKQRT